MTTKNGLGFSAIVNVTRRELSGYFSTPVAWVFIVIFLVMAGVFTFYIGSFYERGMADLAPFFQFHPFTGHLRDLKQGCTMGSNLRTPLLQMSDQPSTWKIAGQNQTHDKAL